MRKICFSLCVLLGFGTVLSAESIIGAATDIAKAKIQADADVAKIKANKDHEVSAEGATLTTNTRVEQGAMVGNSGILAVGSKVNLDNAKIQTDTQIKQGAAVGNTGVALGAIAQ